MLPRLLYMNHFTKLFAPALQRTIYIQIKTMYAARFGFATIGESQTMVKKTRKLN